MITVSIIEPNSSKSGCNKAEPLSFKNKLFLYFDLSLVNIASFYILII